MLLSYPVIQELIPYSKVTIEWQGILLWLINFTLDSNNP